MKELEYPFNAEYILKKRKALKRALLAEGTPRISKRIAVLGGSTTHDVVEMLELFLLDAGIAPVFYQSEYNQYWQDVMFDNPDLDAFHPDLIYIHTSTRNLTGFPSIGQSEQEISQMLDTAYHHFQVMWEKIADRCACPIIQNNFEPPFYRLLGNIDGVDPHGRLCFINQLNSRFAAYAREHENFYLQDINYIAACYGLSQWADPYYWHMYKYACTVKAIPELTFNLANIIKSIYGKNRKALMLDLDGTLWGGVVGDDGVENIEIGQETSIGQLYSEFQQYVKSLKSLGVLLTVNSKNNLENALAGLRRPDSVLSPEDFVVIKANWDSKDQNARAIAQELNLGTDSLVFVDDNPAERHIVKSQLPEVQVLDVDDAVRFIPTLDRAGYFEVTRLSSDDLNRNEMYRANLQRQKASETFTDYHNYLRSLEMSAEIESFSPLYMARIAQLTNKSNQFNLTTHRCSQAEIESLARDPSCITLYGRLQDKFGDNGVVSVVYGHRDGEEAALFHIDLWLMSCRVLKRDMEYAMMDELVEKCTSVGIRRLLGYYFPTAKNGMVKEFYQQQGFTKISEDEAGNAVWEYKIPAEYKKKNQVIQIHEHDPAAQ